MRAEILKINCDTPEISLVKYAADQIRAGEVLGMPTDTFYGLAADPFNLRAVDRVYDIKTRSRHKPLSLLIESVDQAEELAKPLPEEFYALTRKYWPGPLTIIVKAGSRLPLKVTANTGNVALRVPNAKIPLAVVDGRSHSDHRDLGEPERGLRVHQRRPGARPAAGTHQHHCRRRDIPSRHSFYHHRPDRRRSALAHYSRRRDSRGGDLHLFCAGMSEAKANRHTRGRWLLWLAALAAVAVVAFLAVTGIAHRSRGFVAGSTPGRRHCRVRCSGICRAPVSGFACPAGPRIRSLSPGNCSRGHHHRRRRS